MDERPRPDIEHTREAMREHDERAEEPSEESEQAEPSSDENEDEEESGTAH